MVSVQRLDENKSDPGCDMIIARMILLSPPGSAKLTPLERYESHE